MSDNSEIIVAALAERVSHELGERDGDSTASLVFSISVLVSLIRLRLITIDEAIQQLESVFAHLPPGHRSDTAAERLRQATDWLHACLADEEFQGRTIEGTAKRRTRKK